MNGLDENVTRDQADLLEQWGIRCRSLSRDLCRQGMQDEDIIPFLLHLKRPTLLTRDSDFFDRHLVHSRYALAWFEVDAVETAFFIRKFLAHPFFKVGAQRLGKVFHIQSSGIEYWTKDSSALVRVDWHKR